MDYHAEDVALQLHNDHVENVKVTRCVCGLLLLVKLLLVVMVETAQ